MSKYLTACLIGYWIGMKHKQLSKRFCWARMKRMLRQVAH